MSRRRIGFRQRPREGSVVYDPRDLWPSARFQSHQRIKRRRTLHQHVDDARWAVADALEALANACRRRNLAIERALIDVAVLVVLIFTLRSLVAWAL